MQSKETSYHFLDSQFPQLDKILVNNSVILYITNTVQLIKVSQVLKVHCKPVRNRFNDL